MNISEDLFSLNALLFIGIIMKTRLQSWVKVILWMSRALFHISISYLSGNIILLLADGKFNKIALAMLPRVCISLILWHLLLRRMKHARKLLPQIYGFRKSSRFSDNKISLMNNGLLLLWGICALIFFIVSILLNNSTNRQIKAIICLNLKVEGSVVEDILLTMFGFYCSYVAFILPTAITLFVCCIEYRVGEILNSIRKRLEEMTMKIEEKEIFQLTRLHSMILDVIHEVKILLSPLLFTLISLNIWSLFISLTKIILSPFRQNIVMLQIAIDTSLNIAMVTATVICGSMIPGQLSQMKVQAKQLIRKKRNNRNKHFEVFYLLEIIADTEIIYFTGCNIIKIEKKLVLSLFGSLLTYGLLIIGWN